MLTIENLTTDYGPVRAVDHVSFEVPKGSVTAVLGANGAGKTSLLRTVTGLVRPSSGSVKLAGEDITRLPVEEIVRRGHGPRSRRPRRDRRADGRGEPTPRRSVAGTRGRAAERDLRAVPSPGGARGTAGVEALRRRAADALDRPGAGGAAAGAAARRAVARARAGARGSDHGTRPPSRRHARPGGGAGRAERTQRVVDRQPRRGAEPRAGRRGAGPDKLVADDQLLHAYLGF